MNFKQQQVFDFVYSWAKETVKRKSSKNSETIKLFYLVFFSGSTGVGKSHLVKIIHQAVSKLLQYHGTSHEKPRVLVLAPTGVASINVNGTTIHSALNLFLSWQTISFRC